MEFIAYGTLAPSQVSKWNNVCETYRALQKENGVNEALDEIKEKIELLNEEQDHIDSKRESRVSMIIAVFGFVSIVAAALQILDYLSSGRGVMIGGFVGAVSGILGISLFLYSNKKRRLENLYKRLIDYNEKENFVDENGRIRGWIPESENACKVEMGECIDLSGNVIQKILDKF